ncbi:MAG: TIGR03435 family protein, partial [Candidatus Acidiferrales bacterium]
MSNFCRDTARPHGWKTLVAVFFTFFIPAVSGTFARPQSAPAQSFDVISIKPNHAMNAGSSLGDAIPGSFTVKNVSLLYLVEYAYDVKQGQIEGLPSWASSEKYDIIAKIDDAATAQEKSFPYNQRSRLAKARVQGLFADRFGLKLHHEVKDLPVLELTVAKGGPKLSEAAATPTAGDAHPLPPGSLGMRMNGGDWIIAANLSPLRNLINPLSAQPEVSGRVLLDRTGLNGKYTFTLQWARESLSAATAPASETPGPSLFTALEDQLGLR